MFKFIIATIVFLIFGYVGFTVYNHYKNKQELIKSFNDYIEFSRSEIEYMRTDIVRLCKKFTEGFKINKTFKGLIDDFINRIKSDKIEQKEEDKKLYYLESKELETIKGFLDGSLKLVNENNKSFFDYYKIKGCEMLEKATKEIKTKGELYKKLSILCGIFLFIILI